MLICNFTKTLKHLLFFSISLKVKWDSATCYIQLSRIYKSSLPPERKVTGAGGNVTNVFKSKLWGLMACIPDFLRDWLVVLLQLSQRIDVEIAQSLKD